MDEKRKKVAAVKYIKGESAPSVIAKGKGVIAEKLLEKADETNVPIYRDEKLVDELTKIEIGDFVPPDLYAVVAEILVFVTDMDKLKDRLE